MQVIGVHATKENQEQQWVRSEFDGNFVDIRGQTFGLLTAVHPTELRDKKGSVYWACVCECKKIAYVTHSCLVYGGTRSCGCLKEKAQAALNTRLHFVDGTCIEWIEKRKHRNDNTSGFRGVSKVREDKWRVGIGFKGKRYHVGYFKSFEEAKQARLNAEDATYSPFLREYYAKKGIDKPDNNDEPLKNLPEKFRKKFIENLTNAYNLPSEKDNCKECAMRRVKEG